MGSRGLPPNRNEIKNALYRERTKNRPLADACPGLDKRGVETYYLEFHQGHMPSLI